MSKIQVVGVSDLQGTGKESGKPYHMRNVKVIATDAQGVCEVGEISFFKREGVGLPEVIPGKSYTPVITYRSNKGKIAPEIVDLKAAY